MSKISVLLAWLLSLSAWSQSTNRAQPGSTAQKPQATVFFQDPMLGTVKMRQVYTPRAAFGGY